MAVDFAAYVFPGKHTAEEVLREAERAASAGLAWIEDVAVIRRGKLGRVSVNSTWAQDDDMVGANVGFGSLTGAFIGALAGPGGALVGLFSGGALGGMIGSTIDFDMADPMLEEFANRLEKDTSALVLIGEVHPFLKAFEELNGTLFQTAIPEQALERLRGAHA